MAWLVAHKHITEYQAKLLLRGQADHHFIQQYKILERIGCGCMAGVYRAEHTTGQIVAIKVLPPSKSKEGNVLARFQRESRLAIRLKHPNVVRTFQAGKTDQLHFIVMEYLEGETLDEVLQRRGTLPPNEAVRIIYQAFLGLQHIHTNDVVHRDLKPANLMLVPARQPGEPDSTLRATVKILDIGLARAMFEELPEGTEVADIGRAELTRKGDILGTPAFMAPEQAQDARKVDIRADIYSLGCVLYYSLAGRPPFVSKSLYDLVMSHALEPAKPLSELNASVPERLQQVIDTMMAKDPAQRFATPELAAQALKVFVVGGSGVIPRLVRDVKMESYLAWLDTLDREAEPAPTPTSNAPAREAMAAYAETLSPESAPQSPPKATRPRPRPDDDPMAVTPSATDADFWIAARMAAIEARAARLLPPSSVLGDVPAKSPATAPAPAKAPTPAPAVSPTPTPNPTPPPATPAPQPATGLTVRECLFFGGGVLCVLLVEAVAWLAVRFLGPHG
jgi:serine/threonine protein kinase